MKYLFFLLDELRVDVDPGCALRLGPVELEPGLEPGYPQVGVD